MRRDRAISSLSRPSRGQLMAKRLQIVSPKRNKRLQTGWEGFFPYYAGYPELFARELLQSAKLPQGAVVLDGSVLI
jgi:hypothetical protein